MALIPYVPVDGQRSYIGHDKKIYLNNSIALPSYSYSYTFAIEFMKKWILSNFNKDYFKSVNVDGRHVLRDFKDFDITKTLKAPSPSLLITPQLEFEFDRDYVDQYQSGIKLYTKPSKLDTSFFKDYKNNLFLGMGLEIMKMQFALKIKVGTRAQQVDLYKYIQMKMRIGSTHGVTIPMDMHIPYHIMLQIARDAGYTITDDDKIKDINKFVSYLNTHCVVPIIYRYRRINGKFEFFMRLKDVYMHIDTTESLSADDGEREGMVFSNYMIETNITLHMPVPKMYMYYSIQKHDIINIKISDNGLIPVSMIALEGVREYNNDIQNWNIYMQTDCEENDMDNYLSVDLKEILPGELTKVIDYNKTLLLTPDNFLDIKLFCLNSEVPSTVNWETLELKSNVLLDYPVSTIGIYADLEYLKSILSKINEKEG